MALTPKPKPPLKLPRGIFIKDPRTGIFWIRYTDAVGKLHREIGGTTQTKAEEKLALRRAEKYNRVLPVIQGNFTGPEQKSENVMFDTITNEAIKFTSVLDSAYDLKHKFEIIREDFKDRAASSITQEEIIEWLDEMLESREWKPASWNRYQAAWSTIFRIALKKKRVIFNPAAGIEKQAEDNSRVRFLTVEEEPKLLAKVRELESEAHANIVIMKLHTGMRTSEMKRMVAGDYSTETGMLTVHQRKNKKAPATRHVPLDPIGVAAYKALAEGKERGELLYPELFGKDGHTPQDFGWITDAAVAAGIEDFTPHDCRHHAASRWVMAGISLPEVSRYLGHSTPTMTFRYTHLLPGNRDRAIAAMMSYYEPKPAKKSKRISKTG